MESVTEPRRGVAVSLPRASAGSPENNIPRHDLALRTRRFLLLLGGLLLLLTALFLLSLALGSVQIPLRDVTSILWEGTHPQSGWANILWKVRLPKAITAMLAGAGLAVAGLQMQTLFRNALAGPYVLGISSGASLGVAFILLAGGSAHTLIHSLSLIHGLGTAMAAIVGAGVILLLVMAVSRRVHNSVTLLLLGLMFGYGAGAIVTVLLHFGRIEAVQAYVNWTFGSFGDVTWSQLGIMAPLVGVGLGLALLCAKSLNAVLLGELYAQSMGVDVGRARLAIIASTAVLAGVVTAFCGPIAFLGIAVPHVARGLFGTGEHQILLPATLLLGAAIALLADIVAQLPGSVLTLPLNAVTALVGAPIVVWVILRRQQMQAS